MEDYKTTRIFQAARDLTEEEIDQMKKVCSQIQGIIAFKVDKTEIWVEYFRHLQNFDGIKELLKKAGFPLAKPQKKEGFFTRFLKKLAKDNKEEFGSKALDCCDLNH